MTAVGEPADVELRRLRWRCRRGMRELDVLTSRYLDQRWAVAEPSERAAFVELLGTDDDRLWRWLMGREPVSEPGQAAMVAILLSLPADASRPSG